MRIGRVSLDIFGLIAFGEFTVHTRVIRAGKTIELIEAEMQANGKTCIVICSLTFRLSLRMEKSL